MKLKRTPEERERMQTEFDETLTVGDYAIGIAVSLVIIVLGYWLVGCFE